MTEQPARPATTTLAYKLNRLFETIHPRDRGEYANKEVADAIEAERGLAITPTYIGQLRGGARDNPSLPILEALAWFFAVHPSYFLDGEAAERVERELDLIALMRDTGVQSLLMRATEVSPERLDLAMRLIARTTEIAPDRLEQAMALAERASELPEDRLRLAMTMIEELGRLKGPDAPTRG
jgi:hypothetical protein